MKNMPNVIGRSHRIKGSDGDWNKVKPLFPDRMSEGARLFQKWGFLPVNHAYIIRGEIYKKYPWVAFNLYSGFVKAKQCSTKDCLNEFQLRCSSARNIWPRRGRCSETTPIRIASRPIVRCWQR